MDGPAGLRPGATRISYWASARISWAAGLRRSTTRVSMETFRQGRPAVRGRLVQAESRLSLTASAADRWLPVRPGTEPQFLAAVGRILLDSKLARNVKDLPKAAADAFHAADVKTLLAACGLDEKRVREAVQELGESPAPLVIGGRFRRAEQFARCCDRLALHQRHAGKYRQAGRRAGSGEASHHSGRELSRSRSAGARAGCSDRRRESRLPFPKSSGVEDALKRAETVISFGSFLDDSSAWADSDPAGSRHAGVRNGAGARGVAREPGWRPRRRSFGRCMIPERWNERWPRLREKMQRGLRGVSVREVIEPLAGGTNGRRCPAARRLLAGSQPRPPAPHIAEREFEVAPAPFAGDAAQYPLHFQPYLSLQYHDGAARTFRGCRSCPIRLRAPCGDCRSRSIRRPPRRCSIANGDIVRVESPHGSTRSAGLCASRSDSRRGEHGDRRRAHALRALRFRARRESALDSGAGVGEVDGRAGSGRHARAAIARGRSHGD